MKCGSTTSLMRHVRNKHPDAMQPEHSVDSVSFGSSTEYCSKPMLDTNSHRAQALQRVIAEIMIIDLQPYDIVNDQGFKNFVTIAEPLYKIPCRTTFSRDIIPKMYKKEAEKIKKAIRNDLGYLVIKDAIKNTGAFDCLCRKYHEIVSFFNRSTLMRSKILKVSETHCAEETPLQVIQDVNTRWNSQYDMMKRLMEIRIPLSIVLSEPGMPDNITSREWDALDNYIKVLEVLAEKQPTLCRYLPIIIGLHQSIDANLNDYRHGTLNDFATNLKSSLTTRFQFAYTCEPILFAMLLDPRVKNRLLDDVQQQHVFDILQMRITKEKETLPENAPTTSRNIAAASSSRLSQCLYNISAEEENNDATSNGRTESMLYLNDMFVKSDTKIINWWKTQPGRFPALAMLAKSLLGIPATQVPSERLFSTAGNIVSANRTKLLTDHVEEICFLHENIKIK
ncbi:hypothetical protein KPH14_000884 [Odynerus spinipes]|uniref:HAT C-terminal dimerisation domain-containing protein n=1 Tax=Odynerus spinipes TaxID=1348599 RepID=A0AAD9VLF2_9HYME|nr:hypothetical protein KPH14_000884 [Odynerus spinipes]